MDLTLNTRQAAAVARVGEFVSARSAAGALDAGQWRTLAESGFAAELAGEEDRVAVVLALIEASRLGSLTPLGASALIAPLFAAAAPAERICSVGDPAEEGVP